jgi:hypothetical protein
MRTKLKLPLAKEARNHVPVLRHGLTFGTPYPANLPKGQSRGARSSAGLVTVTVQGERYRSLTRIAFDSIVVDKLLADQPAKLRGVAGVYQRHDFADERARALDASAAHVVGAGEGENVVKLDRVVGVGPGAPQSAPSRRWSYSCWGVAPALFPRTPGQGSLAGTG